MEPNSLSSLQASQAAQNVLNGPNSALGKTSKEFEAMFVTQMLSHMFEGVEVDPMFGGGPGEEMFRSLMVNEYGKGLSQSSKLGIADAMQAQLLKLQEQGQR